MCALYAAHSREVTQESPHLTCWCLCASRAIAVYLTGNRMLVSSCPVVGQCRQREAYCLVSCKCCMEQYYPNMWWKFFVWLGFITCKTIKGKTQRLLLLLLCNSSETLIFTFKVSKKARLSYENIYRATFLMSPALYVSIVCEDQFCLKLLQRPLCLVCMYSCDLSIGIQSIEEPQTSSASSGALNFLPSTWVDFCINRCTSQFPEQCRHDQRHCQGRIPCIFTHSENFLNS